MGFALPSPRRRRLRGRWNTNGVEGVWRGAPGTPSPSLAVAVPEAVPFWGVGAPRTCWWWEGGCGGTGTSFRTLGIGSVTPFLQFPRWGGGVTARPLIATWGWRVFGDPQVIVEVALGHPPLQALPGAPLDSGLNCGSVHRQRWLNRKLPPSPWVLGWQKKRMSSPPTKVTFSKSAPLFWGK